MDVLSAIKGRRSIRSYQQAGVEAEKLEKVLEAGRLAPSASNVQEWKFILVTKPDIKQQLANAAMGQKSVEEAPVIIVACATESQKIMTCGQYAYPIDLAIAVSYMILEAYELGLGTCWLGAFKEQDVKRLLEIPDDVRVVAMFTLGYPKENPPARPRKNLNQVVCYEKYV